MALSRLICKVLISLVASSAGAQWKAVSADIKINEYASHSVQLSDGRICVFFENVESFLTEITQLLYTCENRAGSFVKPQMLQSSFTKKVKFLGNARPLWVQSQLWVYFNAWDGKTGYWGRFLFDENNPETEIEWLESPEDLTGQYRAWIFPTISPQDKVLLSYEVRKAPSVSGSFLKYAFSDEGRSFGSGAVIAENAQMIRSGFFRSGTWAFIYQVGHGRDMMDYVILSKDQGGTFTKPLPVSQSPNVHDPVLLQRADGDIDAYYVVWQTNVGFALFRRHLNELGQFGPEERLSPEGMVVDKPFALRLKSGKIFVTADVLTTTNDPVTTDLWYTLLNSDAK